MTGHLLRRGQSRASASVTSRPFLPAREAFTHSPSHTARSSFKRSHCRSINSIQHVQVQGSAICSRATPNEELLSRDVCAALERACGVKVRVRLRQGAQARRRARRSMPPTRRLLLALLPRGLGIARPARRLTTIRSLSFNLSSLPCSLLSAQRVDRAPRPRKIRTILSHSLHAATEEKEGSHFCTPSTGSGLFQPPLSALIAGTVPVCQSHPGCDNRHVTRFA